MKPLELRDQARQLPQNPGVYLMKDSADNIIYVGKSKNLRNRVIQYFQSSKNLSPKIKKMIQYIETFEYILTDTELEALLLECKMIKDFQPMFNTMLKNEKEYAVLKVTLEEDFPRVMIVYEEDDDGCLYFGPYPNRNSVEKVLKFIEQRFPLRRCGGEQLTQKPSPCLHHELGLCLAPCQGVVKKEKYMELVEDVISLLSGNGKEYLQEAKVKMEQAAQDLEFEKAVYYRDQISVIKYIIYRQRVIKSLEKQKTILAIEKMDEAIQKVFLIKGNRLLKDVIIDTSRVSVDECVSLIVELILGSKNELLDKETSKMTRSDLDEWNIIFSYLNNHQDNLCHQNVPNTWLRKSNVEKLRQGIMKLLSRY